MPDMERLIDKLELYVAQDDPHKRQWQLGFQAGKTRARLEVAVSFFVAALVFVLLRTFA